MNGNIPLIKAARPFYGGRTRRALRAAVARLREYFASAPGPGRHQASSRHLYDIIRQWRFALASQYHAAPLLGPRIGSRRFDAARASRTEGNHPAPPVPLTRSDRDVARVLAGLAGATRRGGWIRRHSALVVADGRVRRGRRSEFWPVAGVAR